MGRMTGLGVQPGLVRRTRKTRQQVGLSGDGRQRTLRLEQVFHHVLQHDDVVTLTRESPRQRLGNSRVVLGQQYVGHSLMLAAQTLVIARRHTPGSSP